MAKMNHMILNFNYQGKDFNKFNDKECKIFYTMLNTNKIQ